VRIARDGNGAIDDAADQGPQKSRHFLSIVRQDLERKGQRVNVRAVVADNAEGQNDQAEFAKSTQGWEQHLGQQTAHGVFLIGRGISRVVDGGGGDGETQHLGETEREQQSGKDVEEDLDSTRVHRLVAGVVRGVAGPARGESKDRGGKGQNRPGLALARTHGKILKGARVGKLAEDDQEDDEARHPANHFIVVDHLVPEQRHKKGAGGDDDDARRTGEMGVDGVEKLGADNDVDGRPTEASETVEDGDYGD